MKLQKDKEKEEQKVAIVTGSSSRIGQEIALTLVRNDFLTYATMRNHLKGEYLKSIVDKEKLPLKIAQLDVTKETSIAAQTTRIDIVVNNAGYGLVGAFEDLQMEPYSQMMQKSAAVSNQFFQSGSAPELVAKVVLTAINTPNPNLRYLVGKDVEEWVKSKESMTDAEFHNMMAKDVSV
jgi:NAD(P)-dependent dehydrogenase (short-subunit alcohol dehydrogenase family)